VSGTGHSILVLERNGVVGQRLARVFSAAADFAQVHTSDRPAALRERLDERTLLVALESADLDVALDWVRGPFPHLRILTWSQDSLHAPLQVSRHEPRLNSIIGWPAHQSIPRVWELALGARRTLQDAEARRLRMSDVLAWGATSIKWMPRTSAERDECVAEVERYAAAAGTNPRLIERFAVAAHEMLMNAMYDAPADASGKPLYAHDRKQRLSLPEAAVPQLRFGMDGMTAALEVIDPFGRLERRHVLDSILRGMAGARSTQAPVLDTSHGGAGLGFFRLHAACSSLVVEVTPGRATKVLTIFDMDASARESRTQPTSLHLCFPG
jgi:hypothetical protein